MSESASPSQCELIRIGTRGSRLALFQSNWTATRLRELHPGLAVEIVEIRTKGDRDQVSPLSMVGGTGLFTKEIQRALLDGEVDLAVHSLKDLPTKSIEGLRLSAAPEREDVRDALISKSGGGLDSLSAGARVGTGSLRRKAMLLAARPDLEVVDLRGNVETRLRRALEGDLDAVVLAVAGLNRLGLASHISQVLEPPLFLPAVGQGSLGLETRVDDEAAHRAVGHLNDPSTMAAVRAERRLLAELEGGCQIPLGAWGECTSDGRLRLSGAIWGSDGAHSISATAEGSVDDPERLGVEVALELRRQGAEELLRRPAG
ncbi:MAG: hydroxymethylbilane synthase [Isosphaeraceae bacterium]|nr:hydroxymethylbilane synthase [Isosphaeraceae bacterium]